MQLTCIKKLAGFFGMKLSVFALAPLAALAISSVRGGPVEVASLSTVLADVVREVGGDRVAVVEIVKPGTDPHLYEPTPGDIKRISGASLVLASGLGFEGYLDKLKSSVGKGPTFLVAGEAISPLMVNEQDAHDTGDGNDHGHSHGAGGKYPDPHWWHSIKNVQAVTRQVRDALVAADPDGRTTYDQNARAFDEKLAALAKWVRLQVAAVPKDRRVLVTSHDALGYFARDYGFEIHPVQGISTSDQPSSQKVRALIEDIKGQGVKAIFAENIENPKVLEQITKETGAKPGGILYADGLGTGPADSYEGMMRHNVSAIVKSLQ